DAVGFGFRVDLRLLDRLGLELLADRDDFGGARLRLGQHFRVALLGLRELLAALLAGGEAIGDLLLPGLDGAHQRRPDETRAEPDEGRERDGLHDQRQIEIHGGACTVRRVARPYLGTTESSGLANAKNIARPTPMMYDASIRPSSRKTFACSCGISSGWRAAPSRNRE